MTFPDRRRRVQRRGAHVFRAFVVAVDKDCLDTGLRQPIGSHCPYRPRADHQHLGFVHYLLLCCVYG
jgi:hypothetical protein